MDERENNVVIPGSVFREVMDTLAALPWHTVSNLMNKIQSTVKVEDTNTDDVVANDVVENDK